MKKLLSKFKNIFPKSDLADKLKNTVSQKILHSQPKNGRFLYRTDEGLYFWLNPNKYLDQSIINTGKFEIESTNVVKKLVEKGDTVLDIGANIGYYTVLFSKIIGEKGKVYAFEPTDYYFKVLLENLDANKIQNCEFFNFGFSYKESEVDIFIGDCSATIHWSADTKPLKKEKIKLKSLDSFAQKIKLKKLDFIKIDVDGHEPSFFAGAWKTLEKFNPIILLEINQENYLKAGHTAWDFYDLLKKRGYKIYNEDSLKEFPSKREFLIKCGNFAYSANIVISKNNLKN